MRWICDAYVNADLEEIAFAGMGVTATLEHVDLSSAPRGAADVAACLMGRLVRELAEATVSHDTHAVDDNLAR
ncbi:hypothetical protein VXJ24_09485 [Olsenella sp. YH-ols2221]|uniref:hypothetical protein n=1 Tax=Olsenella kribbiana TaxID=3115221 RepID=UPI002EDA0D9B